MVKTVTLTPFLKNRSAEFRSVAAGVVFCSLLVLFARGLRGAGGPSANGGVARVLHARAAVAGLKDPVRKGRAVSSC